MKYLHHLGSNSIPLLCIVFFPGTPTTITLVQNRMFVVFFSPPPLLSFSSLVRFVSFLLQLKRLPFQLIIFCPRFVGICVLPPPLLRNASFCGLVLACLGMLDKKILPALQPLLKWEATHSEVPYQHIPYQIIYARNRGKQEA